MVVAMMVDNPEGWEQTYEGPPAAGLMKPAWGILHVAGPSPNGGWRVIEVFASDEDAQRSSSAQAGLRSRRRPSPAATQLARAPLHEVGAVTMNYDEPTPP